MSDQPDLITMEMEKHPDANLRLAILMVAQKLVEHDLLHTSDIRLFPNSREAIVWFVQVATQLNGSEPK